MAICKCKMCGGDLNITELDKVGECEYCGTTQTVPSADNEKKMTLFNRANRLRSNNEFDKAAALFEQIVAEFPEEAEAYWGLCLCNYGIEYVDDPGTGKKIPTCHRASFEKLTKDENFALAMEYADVVAQRVYRREAQEIDRINEEILSVSRSETPYDIFICYKETDENGSRTPDSVMAQDIYDALTAKGYKVFFSRVSLEDKLGQQYEPYIFAALNSAKIMLSVGTKYEYFHAVWVKNEWSRFLRLAAKDKSKVLIPCYKDMDPYDMPDEFQPLQAQDLGKLGAIQDLVRGIDKLLAKDVPAQVAVPAAAGSPAAATTASLLDRAFLFLEDGNWQSADEYAEKVLDVDPRCGEAYLAKAMAAFKVKTRAALAGCIGLEHEINITKVLRFGTSALKEEINGYIRSSKEAEEAQRRQEESRKQEEERRKQEEEERRKQEEDERRKEMEDDKEKAAVLLAEQRARISRVQGLIAVQDFGEYGLRIDGSIVKHIADLPTDKWKNIAAISASSSYIVGLKTDGTVIAAGKNQYGGIFNVSDWRDIIAVSVGFAHAVGLKKDGTVVAVGNNESGQCEVSGWRDIIAVAAGSSYTLGLKKDGTVISTGYSKKYYSGECDVSEWHDIVAIATSQRHTIGLRKDGTVVATRYIGDKRFYAGQCDTSNWRGIVAIAAAEQFSIGLKYDGTVVATNYTGDDTYTSDNGQGNVSRWKDIVAIAVNYSHTMVLKKDGTVITTSGMRLFNTKLFNSFDSINEEKAEYIKRAEKERQAKIADLTKEKNALETELPTLNGFFKSGRRKEVEARLAEIEAELKKLQS